MSVRECCAFSHQPVHVWRLDLFVAESVNGVKPLVISKNEQYIRLCHVTFYPQWQLISLPAIHP